MSWRYRPRLISQRALEDENDLIHRKGIDPDEFPAFSTGCVQIFAAGLCRILAQPEVFPLLHVCARSEPNNSTSVVVYITGTRNRKCRRRPNPLNPSMERRLASKSPSRAANRNRKDRSHDDANEPARSEDRQASR